MVDQRGFNKSFRKKEKLCWGECDAPSTVDIGALALFFKATRLKDLWHRNLWPLTKIFDTKNPNARYSACREVWGAPWGRIEKIANVVISWCLLSWFEFLNLSWTVNSVTKSLNQYIIVIVLVSSVRSSYSHPDLLLTHPTTNHFFRPHRSSTLDFHFLSH